MKRSLPLPALLYAFLCVSVLPARAQTDQPPVLKSAALQQSLIQLKTPHLSQHLLQLSGKQLFRTAQARTLSTGKTTMPDPDLTKYLIVEGNKVLVNITLKEATKSNRDQLQAMGVQITATYGRVVSGFVAIDQVEQLQNNAGVQYVRPAYKMKSQLQQVPTLPPSRNTRMLAEEPVMSQGDVAQGSNLARQKYKVTGKGVKIGILSDSYNSAGITNIGVGELPVVIGPYGAEDAVQVLQDFYDGGTDEGRALAEILHDVAPGAELAFHTASYGQANFAKGIVDLADIDCKIIVDDALYPDEPFFQDGIIAQAVNSVRKRGVTYFSAAGNKSNISYESEYRPSDFSPFITSNIGGTAHNFSNNGAMPSYFQAINIPVNSHFLTSFQWSQPFFSAGGLGADSDMDIFLLDANGTIVAASLDDNISSGDPLEIMDYTNNTNSSLFYITILKFSGPDPARLKYVSFGDDFAFYSPPQGLPGIYSPALVGHPNAEGAIAVGAANYASTPAFGINPPQAEYFTSQGGVAILFDEQGYPITPVTRKKPEITAPDGGNTSFFYTDSPQDVDLYPNFFGTSASSAHAAGVAALMMEAQKLKTITPDQIKGILSAKAIDMDDITTIGFDAGFDYKTGAGLIQADLAVDAVRFPKVYVKNLQVKPECSNSPSSQRNWKITNPNPFEVEAHWFLVGFPQSGNVKMQPGETVMTTSTGYLYNREVPNIVIMDWEDNFGFPHIELALSTRSDCNTLSAILGDANAGGGSAGELTARPDIAEAFPNPFNRSFKVYLSCPGRQNLDLEMFGVDGRQLSRRTVTAEGIVTMDVAGYKPGMYYLKVTGLNFTKTIRLMKL